MQALDKYRPFKAAGDDFADSNPIFSFYFYRYYYEIAADLHANLDDPMEKDEVGTEIAAIEAQMGKMQTKSKIQLNQ